MTNEAEKDSVQYIDDAIYIMLSNERDEACDWIRADIFLNHNLVATGCAPERPPYVGGTARSTAISLAQDDFNRNVLAKSPRYAREGFVEKQVKGAT